MDRYNIEYTQQRGITRQIHISDIHFGVIDPKVQYQILEEQFLQPINQLLVDCISIDGDLFDRLTPSNSDATMYASLFISQLVKKCSVDNTTLVILMGTKQHDADQLKLFYHYLNDPSIDIRIVENIQFEVIKGCKVLCIPELYGVEESVYSHYLYESGLYDMVFLHGTVEGAVYGNNSGNAKCFSLSNFCNCCGPIICGHVHTGGCFERYMYYNGSPIRWRFGETEEKGFQIVLYDMDTRYHYVFKQPIQSFRYETISIDDIIMNDPQTVIAYINDLKARENIDYLRVKVTSNTQIQDNLSVVDNYFKMNKYIKLNVDKPRDILKEKTNGEIDELYNKYNYLFDKSLSPYDALARYINDNEPSIFLTGEEIKKLVLEI